MSGPGLLILEPILVPKPWGGHRLERLGKDPVASGRPAGARYGESWEVADLDRGALSGSNSGRTRVAGGAHRGKTLRQLVAEFGPDLLGSASPTPTGDFPLLFKLLDANEHLSIQVHPDESLAGRHPDWFSKTESWYVLDAAPGAAIFKGLRPGVGAEEMRAAAGTPRLVDLMQRMPVQRGEFHHLPGGTAHALGAGITVAEVQTPSDTTFRLYDWTEEYNRPTRRLHLDEALEAMSFDLQPPPPCLPMSHEGARLLVNTPHYWVREHRLAGQNPGLRDQPELRVLAVAEGRATIAAQDSLSLQITTGSTVVIPAPDATRTQVMTEGPTTLLEIGLG